MHPSDSNYESSGHIGWEKTIPAEMVVEHSASPKHQEIKEVWRVRNF